MLTTKNSLKRLNGFIDTVRRNINNKEVLDYLLANLDLATKKGAIINFKDDNGVLIVDNHGNGAFYVELSPSMDRIDKVYTRLTRRAGDFDERVTISFDGDMVKIHQYSSSIEKDADDDRITAVIDEFTDRTFVDDELRFKKHFATNVSYPLMENANSASNLEEVMIKSDGTAAYKKVKVSSLDGDSHEYGIFDTKANQFTTDSSLEGLSEVQIITEEEYDAFIAKQEPRITKELK